MKLAALLVLGLLFSGWYGWHSLRLLSGQWRPRRWQVWLLFLLLTPTLIAYFWCLCQFVALLLSHKFS